jgi:hypothetical protein
MAFGPYRRKTVWRARLSAITSRQSMLIMERSLDAVGLHSDFIPRLPLSLQLSSSTPTCGSTPKRSLHDGERQRCDIPAACDTRSSGSETVTPHGPQSNWINRNDE